MREMCKKGIFSILLVGCGIINLCYVDAINLADPKTSTTSKITSLNTTTYTVSSTSIKVEGFKTARAGVITHPFRHFSTSQKPEIARAARAGLVTQQTTLTPIISTSLNETTSPLDNTVSNTSTTEVQEYINSRKKKHNPDYPKLYNKITKGPKFNSMESTYAWERATKDNVYTRFQHIGRAQAKILEDHSLLEFLNPFNIKESMVHRVIPALSKKVSFDCETLGHTAEYKDIVLFKFIELKASFRATGDRYVQEAPNKKIIFIIHGLSVMGITNIWQLTYEKYLPQLLDIYLEFLPSFDIYVIPMANPDGFQKNAAAIQSSVNWNKNLSPQSECFGVNLDRNFDVAWNSSSSISACSSTYPGPSPFSEPETQAIRTVFQRYGHKIGGFLNVHCGTYSSNTYKGDAILYPKGYSHSLSDDDKYIDMKGLIEERMKQEGYHWSFINMDSLYNWYGRVSGSSVDYAYSIYGIPYAMEIVMQPYDSDEILMTNAHIIKWHHALQIVFGTINGSYSLNDE